MKIEVRLFGCFSEFEPGGLLAIEVPDAAADVSAARSAVRAHGATHWRGFQPELLRYCAIATDQALLRDGDRIPVDGRLCLLPPVCGG